MGILLFALLGFIIGRLLNVLVFHTHLGVKKIRWHGPMVEIATGALFALVAFQTFPNDVTLTIRNLMMTVFLIVIFVYDLKFSYILDRFTVPAMVLALLFNVYLGIVSLESMVIGAVVVGGFFLVQYLISKGRWIGGGDVRLGIVMGLLLGWPSALLALFIGYVLGGFVGIGLILLKRKKIKSAVPFGTFLGVGTFVAMLWGQKILEWYLGYLS